MHINTSTSMNMRSECHPLSLHCIFNSVQNNTTCLEHHERELERSLQIGTGEEERALTERQRIDLNVIIFRCNYG